MEQPNLTTQLAALAHALGPSHPQAPALLRWAILHIESQDEALTEARPPANATQWAGGAYWRQPPARTWHKGITGRLIHLSATRDDTEDDDAKEAQ